MVNKRKKAAADIATKAKKTRSDNALIKCAVKTNDPILLQDLLSKENIRPEALTNLLLASIRSECLDTFNILIQMKAKQNDPAGCQRITMVFHEHKERVYSAKRKKETGTMKRMAEALTKLIKADITGTPPTDVESDGYEHLL